MFGNQTLLCQVVLPVRSCAAAIRLDRERAWRARPGGNATGFMLMDLEMPVVDGWEATRRLKGNPRTRDIPVIVLSAHALAGEREKAIAAGCDEFDSTPIEFDRLVATMRRILSHRK